MMSRVSNLNSFDLVPIDKDTNCTLCEYIWIDGTGINLRSKTKIYHKLVQSVEELDWWAFDGSACHQAEEAFEEIRLKPVYMCVDPFRGGKHKLVLCETYEQDKTRPARFNFRSVTELIMNKGKLFEPQFGFEQEYFMTEKTQTSEWPIGWPKGCFLQQEDIHYCGVGAHRSQPFGRALAEAHMRLCLKAGLKIAGINQEFAPSQWEFQIGVCDGLELGDQVWLARYILTRAGEMFGVDINYQPKICDIELFSSGGHMNFSTKLTRSEGGFKYMVDVLMPLLENTHNKTMPLYGEENERRLLGKTSSAFDKFDYKVGKRKQASVRIPIQAKEEGKGFFEDRRPASNIDPYIVTAALVDICSLEGRHLDELNDLYERSRKMEIPSIN